VRFGSLPPSQIVPLLADEGRYLASESSFYRVLRQAGQDYERIIDALVRMAGFADLSD
jgi:putative transposase